MEDYKLWLFECYATMCNVFEINNPPELIIKDLNGLLGVHNRKKYLQLSISRNKKNCRRKKIFSESNWQSVYIAIDRKLAIEGYLQFKDHDILLTWAEDTLVHEICHHLKLMKHRKRFYRKYRNMVNKYIANRFDCSMIRVKKLVPDIALESRKILYKRC